MVGKISGWPPEDRWPNAEKSPAPTAIPASVIQRHVVSSSLVGSLAPQANTSARDTDTHTWGTITSRDHYRTRT